MPLATVYQVCLDVQDLELIGRFWADALALDWHRDDDYPGGGVEGSAFGLRLEQVADPKVGKNRVHPDIYVRSLDDLVRLGSTVLLPEGEDRRWTVMADVEGNEYCAFLRDDLPANRMHGVGIDAVDHVALARWWADVLEATVTDDAGGFSTVEPGPGRPFTMDFATVPEAKIVKNRMHWDVRSADPDALLDRGATLLAEPHGAAYWQVLADPEGNEFCVFPPAGRP